MFRPCIDLHEGKVKQIVGGTLGEAGLRTNFVSERPAEWFAELYRRDPATGQTRTCTVDCSGISHNQFNNPDLWLRDGDVIEIPEKS